MSPRAALWLLLVLPTAVQGQTPSPLPTFTPMKSFHHDQFQGEWFVLGLAGNNYRKEDKALLKPYITTIVPDDKGQLQVSSAMKRGKRCDTWSYVMIPAQQPGQFTIEHKGSTADQEDMRVIDTDYTKFALMLSLRRTGSRTVIRVSLLGRNWNLPSRTLDRFACLALSQGLKKKDFMFPDMTVPTPSPGHLPCFSRMAARNVLWVGLVLLGVLGGLQTQANDPNSVQPYFQPDKFLGPWYSVGLASNASWFLEKKNALSMCQTTVAPSGDGGLNLTSTFLRKNQCETRVVLLQPTAHPGQYTYHSPHWGSVHSVSVVKTNYEEYAMLFSKGLDGPHQDFRMASLYSRTQTPKAELKEDFAAFCKSQGLTEDTIVFLPQPDKCINKQE
ncbi:uncharacterized protein [Dipodomys merriami]|uniref:uncharacterized protein isoform X1 n=2 Tax=Dipodomys merriami TaxID=94247 RepID=UPI00384E8B84